jgi:hypothetical protein
MSAIILRFTKSQAAESLAECRAGTPLLASSPVRDRDKQ